MSSFTSAPAAELWLAVLCIVATSAICVAVLAALAWEEWSSNAREREANDRIKERLHQVLAQIHT